MSMMTNTLGRYFAGRFVVSALGVFASIFVLLVLVDYIEMVRKTSGLVSASAIMVAETSLFRVPQLLEKMMPFCMLIGAMTCYLALSRRLELVVARAAGVSAWQFIAPALSCEASLLHHTPPAGDGAPLHETHNADLSVNRKALWKISPVP